MSDSSETILIEPARDAKFVIGAILAGCVLLFLFGGLLALYVNALRPAALEGMRPGDLLRTDSAGSSFVIPTTLFRNAGLALISVLIFHELAHGLFYRLFSRQTPRFGFHGLFPYAAAPAGARFPQKQFIAIGLAPLALITPVGLLLMAIAPSDFVPFLMFFTAFNAAGAGGDLVLAIQLARFPAGSVMEDDEAGVRIKIHHKGHQEHEGTQR